MSTNSAEARGNVCPLTEESSRKQVMRRLIGPLAIAYAIRGIDVIESTPPKKPDYKENMTYFELVKEWKKTPRNFKTIVGAVFGLGIILQANYSNTDAFSDQNIVDETLDDTQRMQFKWQTFEIGADETYPVSHAANVETQAPITAHIILPAYLIAKYNCEDEEDLLEVINTISLQEIEDIMSSEEFEESLIQLSYAPNATFEAIIHHNNDIREDEVDAETLDQTLKNHRNEDHDLYEPFSARFAGLGLYSVFVKDGDNIKLNDTITKELRKYLREGGANWDVSENEIFNDSIGCPANVKKSRLHPSDLSPEQLTILTTGDDPIAHYDPLTGKLEILRHPIRELHQVHLKALSQFIAG